MYTVDQKNNKMMLVGECVMASFADSAFAWFEAEKDSYVVLKEYFEDYQTDFENITIKVVLGTWCSDSRREVPRFIKILEYIKFPIENLKMICVDRNKKDLSNEVESLDIKLVPTFIIRKGEKEIGRIIETPVKSLEEDLLIILMSN